MSLLSRLLDIVFAADRRHTALQARADLAQFAMTRASAAAIRAADRLQRYEDQRAQAARVVAGDAL